jgi:predicted RNase H-like HicB family nuclease
MKPYMEIAFTTQVFKEGKTYVAYTPELDVSSCGRTEEKARRNLIEAVRLFLEEAGNMGTLDQILEEAGYVKRRRSIEAPKLISVERATIALPLAHAKT